MFMILQIFERSKMQNYTHAQINRYQLCKKYAKRKTKDWNEITSFLNVFINFGVPD